MFKKDLPWLVYVGAAMSVLSSRDDAQSPAELWPLAAPKSNRWLLGDYGEAKFRAEELVRRYNKRKSWQGGKASR